MKKISYIKNFKEFNESLGFKYPGKDDTKTGGRKRLGYGYGPEEDPSDDDKIKTIATFPTSEFDIIDAETELKIALDNEDYERAAELKRQIMQNSAGN